MSAASAWRTSRQAAPPRPERNFRLASVTKQFTAMAVLLLVQDGRLDTLATLRELFPDFPAWADAVTIQHLLTHTAGLVDYEDVMRPGDTTQILDAGVLDLLRTQYSTYFPPGTAFRYSNSAYAVLAMVVERVSGQRFGPYLAERVFAPLGMDRTVAHEDGVTTVTRRLRLRPVSAACGRLNGRPAGRPYPEGKLSLKGPDG